MAYQRSSTDSILNVRDEDGAETADERTARYYIIALASVLALIFYILSKVLQTDDGEYSENFVFVPTEEQPVSLFSTLPQSKFER